MQRTIDGNDAAKQQNVRKYEHIKRRTPDPRIWRRAIFNDVSFRLLKGEHIGLIGANGEGKSTFMNIITGKLMPDGVTPYRLEMQAKVGIGDAKNLYDYWGERLYRSVIDDSRVIINLASKEYSKCIEKYLTIPILRSPFVSYREINW